MTFVANGQAIAALVTLVDAIFGLLVALGVLHVKPDQSVVALVVTTLFNLAGYAWAMIQHQQHVTQLQIAHAERMALPPSRR